MVKGYVLSFQPKGGDYKGPYFIKGNSWPEEIKRMVKERFMEYSETEVYIEAIKVKGPDHLERTLPSPTVFTVKQ
jgi:hypothetical protein